MRHDLSRAPPKNPRQDDIGRKRRRFCDACRVRIEKPASFSNAQGTQGKCRFLESMRLVRATTRCAQKRRAPGTPGNTGRSLIGASSLGMTTPEDVVIWSRIIARNDNSRRISASPDAHPLVLCAVPGGTRTDSPRPTRHSRAGLGSIVASRLGAIVVVPPFGTRTNRTTPCPGTKALGYQRFVAPRLINNLLTAD